MGAYSPQQVATYKAIAATIPSFIVCVTAFRLWVKKPARWWWDDMFATLGVAFMVTQQGLLWGSGAVQYDHGVPLGVFYSVIICTFSQVFCARLAILIAVIRIAPNTRTRSISQCIGVFFGFLYLLLIAQLIWVCQTHLEFIPELDMPVCNFTKQVPILQFVVAMVSDSLLIFMPLRSLRLLDHDTRLRRRLMVIFAASICTTIASLNQSIFNLLDKPFAVLIAASLEAWISLLVCNLGIVVTALGRALETSTTTVSEATPVEFSISALRFAPNRSLPEIGKSSSPTSLHSGREGERAESIKGSNYSASERDRREPDRDGASIRTLRES